MSCEEKLNYLISELLKEANLNYKLPSSLKEKQDLLRALMNIRDAKPISDEFLQIQDEYLQEINLNRGITEVKDLSPITNFCNKDVYLWQGDITRLKIDAIVNAANNKLLGCFSPLHACIDNCIHSFAGIQLRLECNSIMQKQGHLEKTGLCKVTKAYNLQARYVLHTVGPIIYTKVSKKEELFLASCYTNCLKACEQYSLNSIAFCCISTGVFNFPQELACKIAIKTVKNYFLENPSSCVKKVVFNVFSQNDFNIYKENLTKN